MRMVPSFLMDLKMFLVLIDKVMSELKLFLPLSLPPYLLPHGVPWGGGESGVNHSEWLPRHAVLVPTDCPSCYFQQLLLLDTISRCILFLSDCSESVSLFVCFLTEFVQGLYFHILKTRNLMRRVGLPLALEGELFLHNVDGDIDFYRPQT